MKINACAPGFRATALNNFGQGGSFAPGKIEDGANNAVRLSLLGKDGESGTFTEMDDQTSEVRVVTWSRCSARETKKMRHENLTLELYSHSFDVLSDVRIKSCTGQQRP
ncbi:unnamed protein product [Cercospora beticola]|nr:unnamed protein product [Cercospora beticola]